MSLFEKIEFIVIKYEAILQLIDNFAALSLKQKKNVPVLVVSGEKITFTEKKRFTINQNEVWLPPLRTDPLVSRTGLLTFKRKYENS